MKTSLLSILVITVTSLVHVRADETGVVLLDQGELDSDLWAYCGAPRGEDDVDGVKAAIAKGANINHQEEKSGQTPIMAAVLRGKRDIVRYLLDIEADVTIGERQGYTPPHGAAFQGRPDVMKMLIDHGLDVNVPHPGDGYRPLIRTCWGKTPGHFETFKVLVDNGVDPLQSTVKPDGTEDTCLSMVTNEQIEVFLNEFAEEL